jgi:D-tyrosyl-tRNA(Tyr) deacylase
VRAVCQRVTRAQVSIEGEVVGSVDRGWLILLGIGPSDTHATAMNLVEKIATLRLFEDADGKMNLSAADVGAQMLVVSQFTLYADMSRGRRPSFVGAASPAVAEPLVNRFVELLRERGFKTEAGRFGAMMNVELVNDGPVTIVLSTDGWG